MKKQVVLAVFLSFAVVPSAAMAKVRSLTKEFTYRASRLDTEASCRVIALDHVKRELLEELGTYVTSSTTVVDQSLQKDEITTLTAGVVQTTILAERWDGNNYWLKARVNADPDEVAASIAKIKNDEQLAQELKESEAEKEYALGEAAMLREELAKSDADQESSSQYALAVNHAGANSYFEQGTALASDNNYRDAVQAFNQAITLRPDYAAAYIGRGIVYTYLGQSQAAVDDAHRATVLNPAGAGIYARRIRLQKTAGNSPGGVPELSAPVPERRPYPGRNYQEPMRLQMAAPPRESAQRPELRRLREMRRFAERRVGEPYPRPQGRPGGMVMEREGGNGRQSRLLRRNTQETRKTKGTRKQRRQRERGPKRFDA